ncbi:hypothetical protein JHK85_012620 [Glycine max]|nr:hypothetical protein JHK85_012620 [Glycine max]
MVRWRTDIFKVHGEQREQESLDVEEDNEKEKRKQREGDETYLGMVAKEKKQRLVTMLECDEHDAQMQTGTFKTEETNGVDRNGPTRIIITSIPYILSESNDAGGYAIAEMFYQAFKTRYGNGIGVLFACYLEEIKHHYEVFVEDVNQIESGCVPLPSYNSSTEGSTSHASDEGASKKGGHSWNSNNECNHGTKASRSDQEQRKGIACTEDEHSIAE